MEKHLQVILQEKLILLIYREFSTNQKEKDETNTIDKGANGVKGSLCGIL